MLAVQAVVMSPRAVLHVGPHKVGSTSLQNTLYGGRGALSHDNVTVFPHMFPGGKWTGAKACASVAACFASEERITKLRLNCSKVLFHFETFLHKAKTEGRGVVLSSEAFDRDEVDIQRLATTLRGFDTEVFVMHRPFFDWVTSMYSEVHPQMSLEKYTADGLVDAVRGKGFNSVAVHGRYSLHFGTVRMRALENGYITRFVCDDVRADTLCRLIRTSNTPDAHDNANKSHTYWKGSKCLTEDQKELLWATSLFLETKARLLMEKTEPVSVTEFRALFDRVPYRICDN